MNRATILLSVLYVIAMFVGCTKKPIDTPTQKDVPIDKSKVIEIVKSRPESLKPKDVTKEEPKTIEALEPPEVKKGDAKRLLRREYDPKEYTKKTTAGANLWFELGEQYFWSVNWDADRKPFTTIVIHHSATSKDTTSDEIDKIQRERLYVSRYKSASTTPFVKGLPVHSGHVIDGEERFISYHHLVYHDGKVTTELSPLRKIEDIWYIDHVGWHAGKWDVNCSSVAICLVGDFSENEPPDAQLRATAGLIAHYRGFNPKLTVKSHSEVVNTECPGKTWHNWRGKIVGD